MQAVAGCIRRKYRPNIADELTTAEGQNACLSVPYSAGKSRFVILPTPTDGLAAWNSSSFPPMELMTMKAACSAGPVALCVCKDHRQHGQSQPTWAEASEGM